MSFDENFNTMVKLLSVFDWEPNRVYTELVEEMTQEIMGSMEIVAFDLGNKTVYLMDDDGHKRVVTLNILEYIGYEQYFYKKKILDRYIPFLIMDFNRIPETDNFYSSFYVFDTMTKSFDKILEMSIRNVELEFDSNIKNFLKCIVNENPRWTPFNEKPKEYYNKELENELFNCVREVIKNSTTIDYSSREILENITYDTLFDRGGLESTCFYDIECEGNVIRTRELYTEANPKGTKNVSYQVVTVSENTLNGTYLIFGKSSVGEGNYSSIILVDPGTGRPKFKISKLEILSR